MVRAITLALALGCAVGCGDAGNGDADLATTDLAAADLTDETDAGAPFSLAAANGVLVQEGTATVEVTLLRRPGFTDAVTLSLGGGPLGVTGSFAPAVLSGSDDKAVLTLNADADAPTGSQMQAVHGDSTGWHATANVSLQINAAAQVSIEGDISDLLGTALAGVTVQVSPSKTTLTDATGHFKLAGVARPYTVLVVRGTQMTAYAGLRRARGLHLIELHGAGSSGGTHTSAAAGSVSGITTPLTANQGVSVLITGPGIANDPVNATASNLAFTSTVQWDAALGTTTPAQFAAFGYVLDGVTHQIASWLGFGQVDMTLTNGVGASMTIPAAAVTTTKTVNATMAVTGTPDTQTWGPVASVDGALALPLTTGSMGSSVSLPVPSISGVAFGLVASSYHGNVVEIASTDALTAAGSITVTVPPGPQRTTPVDGAVGVAAATTFGWTSVPNALYALEVIIGGNDLYLVTSALSTTLTDVSTAGFSLPPSASGTWSLSSVGPATNIDDAAVQGASFFSGMARRRALPAPIRASFSGAEGTPRSFTTSATP